MFLPSAPPDPSNIYALSIPMGILGIVLGSGLYFGRHEVWELICFCFEPCCSFLTILHRSNDAVPPPVLSPTNVLPGTQFTATNSDLEMLPSGYGGRVRTHPTSLSDSEPQQAYPMRAPMTCGAGVPSEYNLPAAGVSVDKVNITSDYKTWGNEGDRFAVHTALDTNSLFEIGLSFNNKPFAIPDIGHGLGRLRRKGGSVAHVEAAVAADDTPPERLVAGPWWTKKKFPRHHRSGPPPDNTASSQGLTAKQSLPTAPTESTDALVPRESHEDLPQDVSSIANASSESLYSRAVSRASSVHSASRRIRELVGKAELEQALNMLYQLPAAEALAALQNVLALDVIDAAELVLAQLYDTRDMLN
ncbi:hypothetical protein AURDEDRAFT_119249 [Auricularia subglabra TFB-10046 SS5]|nr:hypothetical protein AURDEDRAFT_119249 [Auricularia subglabra TFB-10046 SS5]